MCFELNVVALLAAMIGVAPFRRCRMEGTAGMDRANWCATASALAAAEVFKGAFAILPLADPYYYPVSLTIVRTADLGLRL